MFFIPTEKYYVYNYHQQFLMSPGDICLIISRTRLGDHWSPRCERLEVLHPVHGYIAFNFVSADLNPLVFGE